MNNWLYPFSGSSRGSSHRSKDRHSSHHSSHYSRSPSSSFFNLGSFSNRSGSSVFSSGGGSSRRAKPRAGFVSRMVYKIKKLLRDMVRYAKKHPMKVFLMVIMPLITGGVLQKLLSAVGIRAPMSLMGGGSGSGFGAGAAGMEGGGGIGKSVEGLVSVAKMFL